MINNPNMLYSQTYDLYVDSTTKLIYKRNNRHRKTEISESELVPVKLRVTYNGYIMCTGAYYNGKCQAVGIWRVFADVYPDQVHCWESHVADPVNVCELDHINGHETYQSNFPDNLRWTTPPQNRGRTKKTKNIFADGVTEQERNRILKSRQYFRDRKKNDPEWAEQRRKQDAALKRKRYHETKDLRRQQSEALNEQILRIAERK